MGAKRKVRVTHKVGRKSCGESGVNPARDEQLTQFFLLGSGELLDRPALDVDLVLKEFLLSPHRKVLAAAHRKAPRNQRGESGEPNDIVTGIRPGETENERDVGD